MYKLDRDSIRFRAIDGRMAALDIVQFAPFWKSAGLHLAKEVLAEVPEQFVGFMKANGIAPKPPINNPTRIKPPDPEMTIMA